ncbi:MAG: hypothetical protein ACLUVC_02040 [Longibaculum sp.]
MHIYNAKTGKWKESKQIKNKTFNYVYDYIYDKIWMYQVIKMLKKTENKD